MALVMADREMRELQGEKKEKGDVLSEVALVKGWFLFSQGGFVSLNYSNLGGI